MKTKPPVEAELTWAQVHAFRLQGHHLTSRAPKKDLARVVGEIGGVQAQVMSAAELQVGVRVDCRVADVREALWKRKTLAKTWLMRGTSTSSRRKTCPSSRQRWASTGCATQTPGSSGCKSAKPS